MNKSREERLPRIVEDRLQEAYGQIRRGEVKQMKRRTKKNAAVLRRSWISAAAVLTLVILIPSAVYAAVTYFQKDVRREEGAMTYEFALNYELVPGEYQVKAAYVPKGFADDEDGDGKYYATEDDGWITIMPIYTTAEIERINNEITVSDIDKVEHTKLSGMEADVITFRDAEKNLSNIDIFLFNEEEGYVLEVVAGYQVDRKELLKFADSLNVERIGDGHYETADEKAAREKEEADTEATLLEGQKRRDALMKLGIPEEKIHAVSEELKVERYDQSFGFTVTDYAFMSSMEGFAEENFFDFTRFDGWLNADKTLRPYTRRHFDKDFNLMAEEQTEQEFLRVDLKVHCYDDTDPDIPLDLTLQYVTKTEGGVVTWEEDSYEAVPAENYQLQMDDSAVWFDKAVNVSGESRNHFFYREMKAGEELEYTLLFVVDKDREGDFLLYPTGGNNDLWQTESMTAGEIRNSLEGYLRLGQKERYKTDTKIKKILKNFLYFFKTQNLEYFVDK